MKYPKEIGICYYILGKYCFNVLHVIQVFHTNRCKIWPTVLVNGFCKLAAQLVSENSKPSRDPHIQYQLFSITLY